MVDTKEDIKEDLGTRTKLCKIGLGNWLDKERERVMRNKGKS